MQARGWLALPAWPLYRFPNRNASVWRSLTLQGPSRPEDYAKPAKTYCLFDSVEEGTKLQWQKGSWQMPWGPQCEVTSKTDTTTSVRWDNGAVQSYSNDQMANLLERHQFLIVL